MAFGSDRDHSVNRPIGDSRRENDSISSRNYSDVLGKFVSILIKKGKLAFKIIEIDKASVCYFHRPDMRNSSQEKGRCHEYVAEPRQ
jgi:hypothetical protein